MKSSSLHPREVEVEFKFQIMPFPYRENEMIEHVTWKVLFLKELDFLSPSSAFPRYIYQTQNRVSVILVQKQSTHIHMNHVMLMSTLPSKYVFL